MAFNLDNVFKKCSSCGKQALTMSMGFGCNAAAVIGARIIDSPRERIIAILTNSDYQSGRKIGSSDKIITVGTEIQLYECQKCFSNRNKYMGFLDIGEDLLISPIPD